MACGLRILVQKILKETLSVNNILFYSTRVFCIDAVIFLNVLSNFLVYSELLPHIGKLSLSTVQPPGSSQASPLVDENSVLLDVAFA